MKKFIILLPFAFWMILSIFEIASFSFQFKPMYFRAWEYVINEGSDGYYIPFKPRVKYDGILIGDRLEKLNYIPKSRDISHQIFQVDEYGFRNRIGMLNQSVEAVTIGTSWVGGAHETQNNLVSELLTDKYNIRTYNYATQPLQHFWEDERFQTHPPKFILIIGNETEFLQNHYIETLQNTSIKKSIPKWNSYQQWAAVNDPQQLDYQSIAKTSKRFSVTKYYLREAYLSVTNTLFTREQLASMYGNSSLYDANTDIMLIDNGVMNPTISGPLKNNVYETITTLLTTQKILNTRGITMIVAIMPSKESIQSSKFQKVPTKQKTLYYLEQELQTANIAHINLLEDLSSYVNNKDHLIYFRDDTHWNSYANQVIAKKLAEKIHDIEKNQSESNPQ